MRILLFAVLLALVSALPAAGDSERKRGVSSYYLARADQRLCPSPRCGGIWVRSVNRVLTTCGDGVARRECYVASVYLMRLRLDDETAIRLGSSITDGRAVVRGTLAREGIAGFTLDTLDVSEAWAASSSHRAPSGVFRKLTDNGVRCVTTPCFSIHAAALNSGKDVKVSDVDLGLAGAPEAERRAALAAIGKRGLIAAGKVVRKPGAGPAGAGRAFVANQFYILVPR